MRKSFLAGCIFCLLSSPYLFAQELITVTENKYSYRPIVKNNRVLWFETNQQVPVLNQVSIYLFEKGSNKLVTSIGSVLFTGWPDLDDAGNVAYMKKAGSRHEVFLYDGAKETQITNNPALNKLVINMGLATDKVYCGYPRIHNGDIVFKDKTGHIYLYQHQTKNIKKITADSSQIANLGDDDEKKGSTGLAAPLNAHIKYFEFDGNHITWMHEDRFGSNGSKISIYTADAGNKFVPRLIDSFAAWVPNNKGTVISKLWNPFFKACNGFIIWQYYVAGPAINIDDTKVGFYDGKTSTIISSGTYVAEQSVQVTDGKAIWWRIRKEGEGKNIQKFEEVVLYQNGALTTIVSYPEPPKKGNLNETHWEGIHDAEIIGGDIFWVMGSTNCFQHFKMPMTNELYCMYKKTDQIAFFRSSSASTLGSKLPFKVTDTKTFAGGGEFNGGIYAFFNNASPTTRDIRSIRLFENTDTSSSPVSLVDLKKPDLKKWKLDEPQKKQITDAFSIALNSQIAECGKTSVGGEVVLESITIDVTAEKKPTAGLEDILSVTLHLDENANGRLDDQDKFLAKKNKPVSTENIFIFSGDGLVIKKDEPKYFLVEIEMRDDICPCGKYVATVKAEKLSFRKSASGSITATGKSVGGIEMLPAELKEIFGDEQAGMPNQMLPEKLTVIYTGLPVRCGKVKFKITSQPPEKGAVLSSAKNQSTTELVFDFEQSGKDAKAEISLQLGKTEGLYTVSASVVMPEGISCNNENAIYREHAGNIFVQVIDMNNPDYYTSVADNSNPDFSTWKATMSSDINILSMGGQGREGALADGASMLMIRTKLYGLEQPPAGNITVTISGNGNIGHLTNGLGESIPTYNGGSSVSFQWVKTRSGIYGFALFTPPKNYGYEATDKKNIKLRATYLFPGTAKPFEKEIILTLLKPPVAFIHGVWSGKETWGTPYTEHIGQFEVHFIDYAEQSAQSFAVLGHKLKDGIKDIVRKLRFRRIAATRINVVCHSMGGLVTRQFFADNQSADFFRKNNFGQGDIYKLITLGTPHYGSPIAWIAKVLRDANYSPFTYIMRKLGKDVTAGAIDGMCPGSDDLMGLGVTHIPTHSVRAWNFDSKTDALTWDHFYETMKEELKQLLMGNVSPTSPLISPVLFAIKYFGEMTGSVLMSDLYGADKTDMLVTLESQSGGIAQGGNKIFDKTLHFAAPVISESFYQFCETTSEDIAKYIFDILNRDCDDINYYAPKLPKPIISDPSKVCK